MIKWNTPLGSEVRCVITGFKGITIARCEYLNGCLQFCVKPRSGKKSNEMVEGHWIDSVQLDWVAEGVSEDFGYDQDRENRAGGPSADAPKGL